MNRAEQVAQESGSFRCLFYGVDDYLRPGNVQLRYAQRDAEALCEVFGGISGNSTLVTGPDVTKDKIRSDLNVLKTTCGLDDRVLIYFSGHGAPGRYVVAYDSDPEDIAATAIGVDELLSAMVQIPARTVVVLLDCCFAGTDPAKVVYLARSPRGGRTLQPAANHPSRIGRQGYGRVLITASADEEQAWESPAYRHGVFTHHLIKALTGEPDVLCPEGVSLSKLWTILASRLPDDGPRLELKPQTPTYHGAMVKDVYLPRPTPSARFRELWSDRALPDTPANPDPASLIAHGIPPETVEAWSTGGINTLNRLQISAVNERGVLFGSSLVADAPTNSGKTLVGELAALRAVGEHQRAVFLLPSRALVAEQYRKYEDLYGGKDGLRVVRALGSVDDQVERILRGSYDLAVLTYEKFAALLPRAGLLDGLGTVVVDELHNLADPERGPRLELLLTRLLRHRSRGLPLQIVGLSAVLGEGHDLDSWLRAGMLRSSERPVPLELAVLSCGGRYQYLDEDGYEYADDHRVALAEDTNALSLDFARTAVRTGEKVLLFGGSRDTVMKQAEALAGELEFPASEGALAELDTGDTGRVTDRLKACLRHGVAFHTAALTDHQRAVVEASFRRDDDVRIVVCTTTLAQGVNLPADTVIVKDFDQAGDSAGLAARFRNIAGRAGRTGLANGRGRAVLIAEDAQDARQKWHAFVLAPPEKLCSALSAPDRRLDEIVLAVAANLQTAGEERIPLGRILGFLNQSWAAHQAYLREERDAFARRDVDAALGHLTESGLVRLQGSDLVLTALGRIAVSSHLRVSSVRKLVDAFRDMDPGQLDAAAFVTSVQLTDELETIPFTGMARGRDAGRAAEGYQRALIQLGLGSAACERLVTCSGPTAALSRARRAVACLAWASGVPVVQIEAAVSKFLFLPQDADLGPLFQVVERSSDFIGAAVRIAGVVHPSLRAPENSAGWRDFAHILPVRLELGLQRGLAEVALHLEARLPRHVFLKLKQADLCDKQALIEAGAAGIQARAGVAEERARSLVDAAERAVQEAADWESLDEFALFE